MTEETPHRLDQLGIAPVTAEEFERQVATIFTSLGENLPGLEVVHPDLVHGTDGDFVIDATARFEALGGLSFLVLIEAKLHGRPVERSDVQVLREKMLSTGAQKGIVASNAPFQRGALEFARVHGISLVRIVDEGMLIEVRGSEPAVRPQPLSEMTPARTRP